MAYSSLSNILVIVPGFPQTSTSAGYSVASSIISAHITRADAVINGKIVKRYSVPIVPSPPLLTKISEDITAYYTYRSAYTQDNHNKLDYFSELKDDAIKELDDIRDGKIDLFDSSGSLIEERSIGASENLADSTTREYQSYFDVDDELNWKYDPSLLDDISGRR